MVELPPEVLTCTSTLPGVSVAGVRTVIDGRDLVVPQRQTLEIQSDLGGHVPKLEDQPWPAFPADVMSIAIVTATQCHGIILDRKSVV